MKKLITAALITILVLSSLTIFAEDKNQERNQNNRQHQYQNRNFVDENGDGICDNDGNETKKQNRYHKRNNNRKHNGTGESDGNTKRHRNNESGDKAKK